MTEILNRRDFLRRSAGSLAGFGLAPLLASSLAPGRAASRGVEASPAAGRGLDQAAGLVADDGLPPRTVGLRSLGGDFAFDPVGLRLEPGSRVTWLNMGDFHTTTAFHPDNDDLLPDGVPLRIPEGAEPWHSGMLGLSAETEFSHQLRVAGVYDYFCQPHYSFGMVGRLVVMSGDGPAPAARPASELNEASRAEMPSVEAILGPAGRAYEWASRINGVLLLRVHGEPTDDPVSRLAEGFEADEELAGWLARSEGEAAARALDRFVEAVHGDAGYETLVNRADEAKAALRPGGDDA